MKVIISFVILTLTILKSSSVFSGNFETRYDKYKFMPQYPTADSNRKASELANSYLSKREWYASEKVLGLEDKQGNVFLMHRSGIIKEKHREYSRQRLFATINKSKFDLPPYWYGIDYYSDSKIKNIFNSTENANNIYWEGRLFNPLLTVVDQTIYGCFNNPAIFQVELFAEKLPVYGIMTTNELYTADWIAEPYAARLGIFSSTGELILRENLFVNNALRCVTPAQPENDIKETSACPKEFEYFYCSSLPSNVKKRGEISLEYDFSNISDPYHAFFKGVYEPDNIGRVMFAKIFIHDFNRNGYLDILVWHRRFVSAKRKVIEPQNLRFEKEWFTLYEEDREGISIKQVGVSNAKAHEWLDMRELSWVSGWPYNYKQCDDSGLKRAGKQPGDAVEIGGAEEVRLYY